jgi:2-hydroxychromene-2-carboxylate isomerase
VRDRLIPQGVPDQPTFFYDLGSPECYLVAERVTSTLPFVVDWEPVLGRSLGVAAEVDVAALTGRAVELELLPLRIPAVWPPDTEFAMLTATYAKQIGRSIAFSLAAFRQAFAGGRDLGDRDTVLIAAAACEMHPTAILRGVSLRSVTDGLRDASLRARALGVTRLPAIAVGDELFCGEDAPERAAALGVAQ